MADPLRSVDKAYYGSKTPLEFRGTREGRKNPPTFPSYQHKGSDLTASSNKYYASAAEPVGPVAVKPTKQLAILRMEQPQTIVSEIITSIQANATHIQVFCNSPEHVRQAQTAVDMAVGRNVLTREQADGVAFIFDAIKEIQPAPHVSLVLEPVLKQVEQKSDLTDIDEIMPPPPKVKANKKGRKKKESVKVLEPTEKQVESVIAESQEEITEADVAAVFGVVEEGDD